MALFRTMGLTESTMKMIEEDMANAQLQNEKRDLVETAINNARAEKL